MMKNNIFLNLRAGIISLLFLMLVAASCESESNSKTISIEPVDTIVLPANGFGTFDETFYSKKGENVYKLIPAEDYGKEIIFFNPDNPGKYKSYKFDSIRNLDPQKYICANAIENSKNMASVQFLNEWEFYTIRPNGEILDTLQIHDKRENKHEYKMHWFLNMQRVPDKSDQYFMQAHKDIKRKGLNHRNRKQRVDLLKGTGIGVIANLTDTSVNIKRELGRYPEALFSDRKITSAFPKFVHTERRELAYFFKEIDSLFVTDIGSNKTNVYSMDVFDESENNQYDARFLDIYNDPYRNCIYLTYLPPCDKKNEDGFLIDQSKRPWQLIMINKDFKVEGRLTFPDEYSKHYMMIGEKGIYVRNNKLSESNSEGQVSVLYEFKNK